MPTTDYGPTPRETADRYVYEVPSDSGKRTYRVDLVAHAGAGQCSCTDWDTRRWPAIRDGKEHGTRATLCKHGIRVRRYFLNQVLAELAKKEGGE